MTAPKSALEIARQAEELAAKATPGPWVAENRYMPGYGQEWLCVFPNGEDASVLSESDAKFIAFARTALPILARAVIEASKLSEMGQACVDWADDTGECHLCRRYGYGPHDEDCLLRTP